MKKSEEERERKKKNKIYQYRNKMKNNAKEVLSDEVKKRMKISIGKMENNG